MHYPTHPPQYTTLQERLREIADLDGVLALLYWDSSTYMPEGGAIARGAQTATIERLRHEKATAPELGELLETLREFEERQPYSSIEASSIRVARTDYDRTIAVPSEFVARLAAHQTACYTAWAAAREASDFAIVRPALEKTLELSLEFASFFPDAEHPADPAIAKSDPGFTVRQLRDLFEQLRGQLVPLLSEIEASDRAIDDALLFQSYEASVQHDFCQKTLERIGYDFQRGRIDETLHPFTMYCGGGDVRVTNRIDPNDLSESVFCSLHEMGHGLYEQGVDAILGGTPLARGISSGMHEAQARLWENTIGRSRAFWECSFPWLQGAFIRQLGKISARGFYEAVNAVRRSPVRTSADEVTYNLHVIIRFELEVAMLEGKLAIADLPNAWNAAYECDLGVAPADDRQGVLQDVHWYGGRIGGQFQGYTLGNLIAAQLYETALRTHPEIPVDIERGRFGTLRHWLDRNVYRYGRMFPAAELLDRVTGRELQIEPFVGALREKFGRLYGL